MNTSANTYLTTALSIPTNSIVRSTCLIIRLPFWHIMINLSFFFSSKFAFRDLRRHVFFSLSLRPQTHATILHRAPLNTWNIYFFLDHLVHQRLLKYSSDGAIISLGFILPLLGHSFNIYLSSHCIYVLSNKFVTCDFWQLFIDFWLRKLIAGFKASPFRFEGLPILIRNILLKLRSLDFRGAGWWHPLRWLLTRPLMGHAMRVEVCNRDLHFVMLGNIFAISELALQLKLGHSQFNVPCGNVVGISCSSESPKSFVMKD